MLKNILKGSDCAACRVCCVFDSGDVWETPVFDGETAALARERFPNVSFDEKGESLIFHMDASEDGLYRCPMLSENGCMLGENKPFDCKIWPYRVMEIGGRRFISIASVCPTMFAKPLSELCGELRRDGLAERIFAFADKHPDIVKPYEDGYPILM